MAATKAVECRRDHRLRTTHCGKNRHTHIGSFQETVNTGALADLPRADAELTFRSNYAATAENLPVARVGTPSDIAEAAVLLMTNPFITGVTLDLDGGGLSS